MRAAVAQAEQRRWIGQHAAHHVMIAMDVVGDREEQHARAVAAGEVVVAELGRALAGARGHGGDAALGGRLVVGRVAERDTGGPSASHMARCSGVRISSSLASFGSLEDLAAQGGIAQPLQLLVRGSWASAAKLGFGVNGLSEVVRPRAPRPAAQRPAR